MSDTFKFLKQQAQGPKDQPFAPAGQSGPDSAQDFLAKQMAKNKFLDTAQPVENVGKNLTTDPYAYGEGTVPGGEGYKDQQTVLNQKEIDDWHAANPNYKEGGTGEGGYAMGYKPYKTADVNPNRDFEARGQGKIEDLFQGEELEEIRRHTMNLGTGDGDAKGYGLSADTTHHFKETGDKTESGSIESKMRKIAMHLGRKHWGIGDPERIKDFIMKTEGEEAGEGPPKPKMGIKPIEHSQEIKQAKERVKTWEQGIESGQTSKEIFGNATFMDKYQQDFSKGAEGIGTNAASSGQESATSATQSFLDNKVSQVKKTLSPA